MNITALAPNFSICDALSASDLAEVKAQGFQAVICNRMPGEAEDHPSCDALCQAAAEQGLAWREIPVKPGEYTDSAVAEFSAALAELPQPVLAFCRTGRRAASLWVHSQSQQPSCDLGALFKAAQQAGHELPDVRETLGFQADH